MELELTPEFRAEYELGSPIGSGAMGTVFRATQRSMDRPVAIKFLKVATPDLLARFVREGRAMSRIAHPHVVRIYDCGVVGAHPYIVTELLEGGTLRDRLERARLPWREALAIGAACFEGLAACHAAGIVHRDLKPENILFDGAAVARIADLGMAYDQMNAHALTATGAMVGTPLYMAPEQLTEGRANAASDRWSLAAVVFEMIAGELPVPARSLLELMDGHKLAIRRLDEVVPEAPRALATLLERALARDEHARPEAAEIVEAFTALRATPEGPPAATARTAAPHKPRSGALARTATPIAKGRSAASGRTLPAAPVRAPASAARRWGAPLAAALLALAAAAAWRSGSPPPPPPTAPSAPAQAPNALWPELAPAQYTVRDPAGEVPRGPAELLRLRDAHFAHPGITASAFSGDRLRAATLAGRTLRIWNLSDGALLTELVLAPEPGLAPRAVALSRDGGLAALAGPDAVLRWDWAARQAPARLADVGGARQIAVLRDGIACARAKELWIAAEARRRTLTVDPGTITALAAAGDGLRLAVGRSDGSVQVVAFPGERSVRINAHGRRAAESPIEAFEDSGSGSVKSMEFTPDGKWLVTGGSEGHARVWSTATGKLADTYSTNGAPIYEVSVRRDGRALALRSHKPENAFVAVWELASLNPGHLATMGERITRAVFSATDELWVVTADRIRRATLGPRGVTPVFADDDHRVPPRWLPDSRHVAMFRAGRLEVWDTIQRRRVAEFPALRPAPFAVRHSTGRPRAYLPGPGGVAIADLLSGEVKALAFDVTRVVLRVHADGAETRTAVLHTAVAPMTPAPLGFAAGFVEPRDPTVKLTLIDAGGARRTTNLAGVDAAVCFDRASARVAAWSEAGVELFDVATLTRRWHAPAQEPPTCTTFAFTDDGRHLVIGDGRVLDAATGEPVARPALTGSAGGRYRDRLDRFEMFYSGEVVERATGRVVAATDAGSDVQGDLSPDGRLLAQVNGEGITVLDAPVTAVVRRVIERANLRR